MSEQNTGGAQGPQGTVGSQGSQGHTATPAKEGVNCLAYTVCGEIEAAYKAIPVRTEAIVDVALNIVQLKPHVEAMRIAIDKVLAGAGLTGAQSIPNTHPKFEEVIKASRMIEKTVVEVGKLHILKKEDLRMSDLKDQQDIVALLIHHGLLKL